MVSASSLESPLDVWTDGNRVVVADGANGRVLIWNSWPTTNAQPATSVLGQTNFSSNSLQPTSATSFDGVGGIAIHGSQFFVTDYNNNRVLIFNSL